MAGEGGGDEVLADHVGLDAAQGPGPGPVEPEEHALEVPDAARVRPGLGEDPAGLLPFGGSPPEGDEGHGPIEDRLGFGAVLQAVARLGEGLAPEAALVGEHVVEQGDLVGDGPAVQGGAGGKEHEEGVGEVAPAQVGHRRWTAPGGAHPPGQGGAAPVEEGPAGGRVGQQVVEDPGPADPPHDADHGAVVGAELSPPVALGAGQEHDPQPAAAVGAGGGLGEEVVDQVQPGLGIVDHGHPGSGAGQEGLDLAGLGAVRQEAGGDPVAAHPVAPLEEQARLAAAAGAREEAETHGGAFLEPGVEPGHLGLAALEGHGPGCGAEHLARGCVVRRGLPARDQQGPEDLVAARRPGPPRPPSRPGSRGRPRGDRT